MLTDTQQEALRQYEQQLPVEQMLARVFPKRQFAVRAQCLAEIVEGLRANAR